jgi:hypothetical protein
MLCFLDNFSDNIKKKLLAAGKLEKHAEEKVLE